MKMKILIVLDFQLFLLFYHFNNKEICLEISNLSISLKIDHISCLSDNNNFYFNISNYFH